MGVELIHRASMPKFCGVKSQMKTVQKSHVSAIPARFDALPLLRRGKGHAGKNSSETVACRCAGDVTWRGVGRVLVSFACNGRHSFVANAQAP